MSYKIWGSTDGMFSKEGIAEFFESLGVGNALSLLLEAEKTRKASVRIGGKKVMLFKM